MERNLGSYEIILLFDNYTSESKCLYESVIKAGYECLPIVIEENDFLPKEIFSVYDLLLGNCGYEAENSGRPRYYNEIEIPDRWSINAGVNEECGKITYQHEEKGRIYYAEGEKSFLVKAVDWYDRKGIIRFRDHYNRFGNICGRTVYNFRGEPMSKTWLSPQGKEIIVENIVTGDISLNDGNAVKLFRSKLDLMLYYFSNHRLSEKRIFYNSLSTPFFITCGLACSREQDVLFWQEPIKDGIPWNMQMILEGRASRTKKIIVQKEDSYNKLLELGIGKDQIYKLGFIYSFQKENQHKAEALICTNSDEIEHCKELIEKLPKMHFHIAALTAMSSRLLELEIYENVSLYQGASSRVLDELFQSCDYYFDINHYTEIVSAVQKAFLHKQLIFAFQETVHNREYVANEHIYPTAEFEKMVSDVKTVMGDRIIMDRYLEKQQKHALAENKEAYVRALN